MWVSKKYEREYVYMIFRKKDHEIEQQKREYMDVYQLGGPKDN